MRDLRLIDSDGYVVPGTLHTNVPDGDADKVRDHLLNEIAPQHAAEWADFGHDARFYRVA